MRTSETNREYNNTQKMLIFFVNSKCKWMRAWVWSCFVGASGVPQITTTACLAVFFLHSHLHSDRFTEVQSDSEQGVAAQNICMQPRGINISRSFAEHPTPPLFFITTSSTQWPRTQGQDNIMQVHTVKKIFPKRLHVYVCYINVVNFVSWIFIS